MKGRGWGEREITTNCYIKVSIVLKTLITHTERGKRKNKVSFFVAKINTSSIHNFIGEQTVNNISKFLSYYLLKIYPAHVYKELLRTNVYLMCVRACVFAR